MVRHFRTIPPHAVQHFHRGEPRRILNVFFFFISAECSSCQHRVHEKHQAALQHVRRAAVCLQSRKAKKKSHAREETKKKTQRRCRTDEEKRKKAAKAQEGTAVQPTETHNTLAETKNKNLKKQKKLKAKGIPLKRFFTLTKKRKK
ncbi:hypothetical protein TCDM_13412 [Trypanosoma cruzi Dm28c]|uniref:Uncharacterized protein n=1 Tax=Trypanosoma cruzi Dm28c TaxID=1416333 RepID=V5AIR7_TRYCR|nr:hypothetical protein TCDM_13412 [Trypanosoma cruzi Dm28c]